MVDGEYGVPHIGHKLMKNHKFRLCENVCDGNDNNEDGKANTMIKVCNISHHRVYIYLSSIQIDVVQFTFRKLMLQPHRKVIKSQTLFVSLV